MPPPRQCNDPQGTLGIAFSLTAHSRITRNEATSSFLRLPSEIRNKIYSELLGDRLIHLRYLYDDDLSFETNDLLHAAINWENEKSRGSAWRHVVCQADCPENEEDQKITSSIFDKEEIVWLRPHQMCDDSLRYAMYCDHETIPLRILRTCRQMYKEANQILWSTNTFSFSDSTTFKRFVGTRSLIQKRTLKKLRFHMDWDMDGHEGWNSALNLAVIRSLQGLRQLRLRIDYELASEDYDHLKNRFIGPYCTSYIEGLKKVAILPLTRVEIVVRNPAYTEYNDGSENTWSKAERREYAEGLRNLLLDPKGAEVYAQKQIEVKERNRKQRNLEAEIKASMGASLTILDRPGVGTSD